MRNSINIDHSTLIWFFLHTFSQLLYKCLVQKVCTPIPNISPQLIPNSNKQMVEWRKKTDIFY